MSLRTDIETSRFFAQVEEFGFFDTVEEHLPEAFTMIYEIARILEDASHAISSSLAPILELHDPLAERDTTDTIIVPHVPDAKEYEADLITSVTEVRYIYPYQHLLPEAVFLQKLAERSLWMPRTKSPRNFRYQSDSNRFAPDDRKQKVYILFDTSISMQQHYRIHLAKAIAFLFLRKNQRELGTIFFRTFDLRIGDLQFARDVPSYDRLIRNMMRLDAKGNGTSLQKALLTAIEDISHESQLSHAQILVITDGVAHVDLEMLQEKLGSQITINTVKIGSSRLQLDHVLIEGLVASSQSPYAQKIRELIQQRKDLESQARGATGQHRVHALQSQITALNSLIQSQTEKFSGQLAEKYGLQIEKLSTVYVQVDDITPHQLFSLSEEKVREFEELSCALLDALQNERQLEDIQRAAILYDHLMLLMKYNQIDAPRFEQAARELENMLDHILNKPSTSADEVTISDLERAQLRNKLDGGSIKSTVSLAMLLRLTLLKVVRWWRTRRQIRSFAMLSGKKLTRRKYK
ncbi:MAG: VWA domain-containing protein [Ignavibacteria bacterium]|nr:VWA domain-containing protein [Ignavibacteria bacterium]